MNPEHLEFAKQGKNAIDAWRAANPTTVLDLSDAIIPEIDLENANLSLANFVRSRLGSARLVNANLSRTDLVGCKFNGANLNSANLRDASLGFADFTSADLRNADLGGSQILCAKFQVSNLSGAKLLGAKLLLTAFVGGKMHETDFAGATILGTTFANVDLSTARNLDSVHVQGPCSIGIDTLYMSRDMIPESFLAKCGVPDNLIKYLPSLLSSQEAIQFYSCFISYSHRDEEFCKRLYSRMRDEHLRVWYAPEDMTGGKKLHEQIDEAIRLHDKLLLVLSEASMGSEWVKTEIWKARARERRERKRVLFPIRLVPFERIKGWEAFDADSGKDMAVEVREYYVPDFSNWKDHDAFETAFERLLKDLRASAE